MFHTYEDFKKTKPLTFAIDQIVPNADITLIGGLSEHGKTLIMLNWVRVLLSERKNKKLWGQFDVPEVAERVIYLTPEVSITSFMHRAKLFHLMQHIKSGRLLVHTLSQGRKPNLNDPELSKVAKGAYIFLDPLVRFSTGSENESSDNQPLADAMFRLIRKGAKAIIGSHHSPKDFQKKLMTKENLLRGTGDFGAVPCAVWGVRLLSKERNIISLECVKSRDFVPAKPFQIIGHPYLTDDGQFRIHQSGRAAARVSVGGAPKAKRDAKKRNMELMHRWLDKYPNIEPNELLQKYKKKGITLTAGAVRSYKLQALQEKQSR